MSRSKAANAMRLAGEYREEGLSPSQALKQGWRDVEEDSMEDNPFGAAGISIGMIALLALAGLLLYRHLNGRWPWQSAAVSGANRALPLGRPRPLANRPVRALPAGQTMAGRPADKVAVRQPEGTGRLRNLGPTGSGPGDVDICLILP